MSQPVINPSKSFQVELEKLLLGQLQSQPESITLRLKLLELYYETRRAEPYLREAHLLAARIPDKPASIEWQKCASMGRMIAPQAVLFRAGIEDRIEFFSEGDSSDIGAAATSTQSTKSPAPRRRLGDDPRFTKYFENLAPDFDTAWADPKFQTRLDLELAHLARRPSALLHARRLSETIGGAQIYLKREDSSPRDTHLIISIVGQALLAQQLGRKTLVTTSVDGRRGVLTASVAARLGMESVIFMEEEKSASQGANVFRIWLLGGHLQSTTNARTGRNEDVRESMLQYWSRDFAKVFPIFGLEGAPDPYPRIMRQFASTIGRECQRQARAAMRRSPDLVVARSGDNSDALGVFPTFFPETQTRLVCVEPAQSNLTETEQSGSKTSLNPAERKIAAGILDGLEYPGVGREHAAFKSSGRVEYVKSSEESAKKAIRDLGLYEGLIPAIQTAHVLGWACHEAAKMRPEQSVVVVIAEDVEKDIWDIGRLMGVPL